MIYICKLQLVREVAGICACIFLNLDFNLATFKPCEFSVSTGLCTPVLSGIGCMRPAGWDHASCRLFGYKLLVCGCNICVDAPLRGSVGPHGCPDAWDGIHIDVKHIQVFSGHSKCGDSWSSDMCPETLYFIMWCVWFDRYSVDGMCLWRAHLCSWLGDHWQTTILRQALCNLTPSRTHA